MYGFALGGFLLGLGSKLAGGDFIYHGFIGVARGSIKSIIVMISILIFACLLSLILDQQLLQFLSNSAINPQMEFMHMLSANMNIGISILLMIASFCWLKSNENEIKKVFTKLIGSFLSGLFLGLGFLIAGLAVRSVFFGSITFSNWNPTLLIFLLVTILCNIVTYHFVFRY